MNLLITGAFVSAKENISKIEELGHTVCFMQYEKDPLPCEYDWVEGVICGGLFLTHPIEKFTNLRYIQLTSAGLERVNLDYIKEHSIELYNARGVYSIPMAEYAITGVLQLYKNMDFFRENQKKHIWEKHRGCVELFGKTVCIVGCGSIGTECAKRFGAFGCNVVGVDLYPREDRRYNKMVGIEKLQEILPCADIVVLCVPLTAETTHLLNADMIALMKQGAVVVNIARGSIMDTEALINAMDKLGGVVLDVFEQEPLSDDSPLWNMQNVIVTPHNSFVGDNNQKRLLKVILDNLANAI